MEHEVSRKAIRVGKSRRADVFFGRAKFPHSRNVIVCLPQYKQRNPLNIRGQVNNWEFKVEIESNKWSVSCSTKEHPIG